MGEGTGFGKTILFGEHFVVYGLEGIPCALGKKTTCAVEKIEGEKGYDLVDNRPIADDYKEKKAEEYDNIITAIMDHLKVESRIKITFAGDLVPASGVGASAAAAASLSQAISNEFNLGLTKEQINDSAYVGETSGSGTPSGIDNTAAVYGGFLVFAKNLEGGKNKIENITIQKPIEIVLINSGKAALTKEVVADVRKLYETKPEEIGAVFEEYKQLVEDGKQALAEYNIEKLAELMEKNQELLRKIDVSSDLLESIIILAKEAGSVAAKLTGTGRGGSVLCLTPGKELQEKVASAAKEAGYEITLTTIG
ncbi:MAG: mevalonate kinase [Candidatus Diapherotrites archaeon]|jgi:mevalonate kinase|uniref:Mevalonate kinase n=1 Tax=Candidatus Iainarchaeum sp. TaxID=3101447 RepID=A0A8T5GG89_9ARCH|nr:mevalonate kinase [Candidatus Diapherotrites archaeon]MBT7241465.1 mevalonate kinase [Candidatus Diapherotrites archaeon]